MGNEQEKDISLATSAVEVVDKHLPGSNNTKQGEVDAFLQSHAATVTFDEAATKRLVRKIDMHLMPLMCVCYFLQFLDKSGITYAAVFGIRADLGLTGYQYSLLGSLFYLGYLCAEYPMAYLSQRLHVGRFIGCIIFIWGWVLMATAICQNFAHVAAVRFFLGVFECALTPSFIMITGMWYTRKEQPFRIGIWYSMNGFGSAFGALISYGTGKINHPTIQSWRFLFIIEGCATILWAFVIFFYFPATPMSAKWLTESEAVYAVERLRANRTGIINREWKWYQVREALNPMVDPTGWLLFWACVINETVNGGIAIYKTLVIKSIGFNQFETALIGIPQGFSLVLWVSLCGYCASRFHDFRIWAMMLFLIPSFIGILLQVVLPSDNVVGRTFGVMLMSSFVGTLAVTMGLPAQNTGGYTKRSVTVGMAFIGYCVGNIIGPLAWVEGQTPNYISGYTTCLACFGGQWILFIVLRIYWQRQNKKRAGLLAEREAAGTLEEHDEFADKTDREDLRFRYNL